MRFNAIPSRPKGDDRRMRNPDPPTRKVFNCIVDESALVAGVKKSTRDGIRKWVTSGAIRLFVPLYTLSQLDRLKKGNDRVNVDAREAIKWLDDITSMPTIQTTGLVQIEGADEMYLTWAEVEKFLLPETLLSMDESESDEDSLPEDLENSLTIVDQSDEASMSSTHSIEDRAKTPSSPRSIYSSTSPDLLNANPYNGASSVTSAEALNRTARNSADLPRNDNTPKSVVPVRLQQLFNHVLWRINQETNVDAAFESFILLTNDPQKQTIGQRFGIRAKRLEQLRDAVGREDRDYKNRLALFKKETDILPPVPDKTAVTQETPETRGISAEPKEPDSDDEDVVLFKQTPRGPHATNGQRMLDPNDFGRASPQTQAPSPRGGRGGSRGIHRGSRGTYAPPMVPRTAALPRIDPNQPIDPDSYSRPPPRVAAVRGGRRKLWEPT
ncbi:uncharacterized protein BDZ99DRAFT_515947 [Mytilinidion resinicola]|uniref:PIN domain-containing protein n=1 Tax=Mytilinidion resinicola TaxID=574789 RepID=A0A6A6Z242_9PEZI|nr:uncharacterized protein BDZ99DRAFT_515947 [Mytilinidion resinicola]KAF2815206.1 hypothetical protein BDZ99DRAFT_515947 [Mytilinidion resinicola]